MPTAQVPQFINLESKIVGPLTLRQFLFLGVGGFLIFILNSILTTGLWILVSIVIGLFSIALAFVKINEQPLHKVLINALKFYINPRLYTWKKSQAIKPLLKETKPIVTKDEKKKRLTVEELQTIAKQLDEKDNK
ncbi:MAG: PrgI family protein [Candidatus Aenigmatarchaeota archaeon]